MRAAIALLVLLGACFKPSPQEGFACGTDNWCPEPLHCAGDHTCRGADPTGDGGSVTDDGGQDDGGSGLPNFAFVTTDTFLAKTLGSAAGADAACMMAAMQRGLPGNFVAWLSITGNVATARLGSASGWLRTDGKPFAHDRADLLAGKILYPLRKTEAGIDLVGVVMTGANDDGNPVGEDCQALTSGTGADLIVAGFTDGGTSEWTAATEAVCDIPWHLACLQKDHQRAVAPGTAAGPKAFVSTSFIPGPGTSILSADMLCKKNATDRNIPGNFKALLSTASTPAIARFMPLPAQPWVRVDGVATTRDFITWDAPINVTADGTYTNIPVFSGSTSPYVKASGVTDTCNDWSSASGTGLRGASARASAAFFGSSSGGCTNPVYCLEVP
jgi:hypothetical protein